MKIIKYIFLVFTLIICNQSFSQEQKEIHIIVKGEDNNPISDAIILFDNIKQKERTNSKGILIITTKIKPKKITAFSPIHGINTISYYNKKYNRIVLKKSGENIIITEQKPSNVIAEQSLSAFQYKNIYEYIRGQVPGVRVTSGNTIIIRGINTVNGSVKPLFIVNKAAVSLASFASTNPADIKKITVLKGPDAAIYGLRGANGVIEVTTY